MALLTFHDDPGALMTGQKFTSLAAAAELVDVPVAICLTADELEIALHPASQRGIARIFSDLGATLGAFFDEDQAALAEMLKSLAPTEDQMARILAAIESHLGGWGNGLVVRSSATDEDGIEHSAAGRYDSVLDVSSPEDLSEAIARCWRSYYGPAAVAARIRAEQTTHAPGMAVIVQRMLEPELAGVAFSDGADAAEVEWVRGRGDRLVAGVTAPRRARLERGRSTSDVLPAQALSAAVARLRNWAGHDVDIEWAYADGVVFVVQVRAVTASVWSQSDEPYFESARLYFDDRLPAGFELGEIADVYASYVSKRAAIYRFAAKQGVHTGAAHVVCLNGLSWHAGGAAQLRELTEWTSCERVLLDVGPRLRQLLVNKTNLPERLGTLLGLEPGCSVRRSVIIRDFVSGTHGVITQALASGSVLVETSRAGLMQMNRGTCDAMQAIVAEPGDGSELDPEVQAALNEIVVFTRAHHALNPAVQLEWVVHDGIATFVDYSRAMPGGIEVVSRAADGLLLSGGVARGPVLHLDTDDALLERLSLGPAVSVEQPRAEVEHAELRDIVRTLEAQPHKPILVARKPYAIFTVLIDHVAGFIFREGALLCHLGIVLREASIPAVVLQEDLPNAGMLLVMDGRVNVLAGDAA
jgi:rifampicin phosphotransferase